MLKKIQIYFIYDGSGQGNTDRNALESTWNSEITKNTVVPSVAYKDSAAEVSKVTVTGNLLVATVFYSADNDGIADWNSFWSTVSTEYAKSTVVKANTSGSKGNKHDCGHDYIGGCKNFTHLS